MYEDELNNDVLLTRYNTHKESVNELFNHTSSKFKFNDLKCMQNRVNIKLSIDKYINNNNVQLKSWIKNINYIKNWKPFKIFFILRT